MRKLQHLVLLTGLIFLFSCSDKDKPVPDPGTPPVPAKPKVLVKITIGNIIPLKVHTIIGAGGTIANYVQIDSGSISQKRLAIPLKYTVISGGSTINTAVYETLSFTSSTVWTLTKTPGTHVLRVSLPDSSTFYEAKPLDYVFTTTNSVSLKVLSKTEPDFAPFNSVTASVPHVQAIDPSGKPVFFVPVKFEAIEGGGKFSAEGNRVTTTDLDGKSYSPWTLGPAGAQKARVGILHADLAPSASFEFTAVGTGSPKTGVIVAGGGAPGAAAGQLNSPNGIWVDKDGALYVADGLNHRVQKWLPGAASGITVAGGNGSGNAANQLNQPKGIYFDKDENLYVADYGNNRIQKFAKGAATATTIDDKNLMMQPESFVIENDGALTVATAGRILKKFPGAAAFATWTFYGGISAGTQYPHALALDATGNLFYSVPGANCIKVWPVAGPVTSVAGGTDGSAFWQENPAITSSSDYGENAGWRNQQLYRPSGIALDNARNIYIGDAMNNRIQKWAPGGTTGVTVAGGNGAGSAANQLNRPTFVFVAVDGSIYVSDTGNNRVMKFAQ